MSMPKLHASVKRAHDIVENIDYYYVVVDVYERGPNLTKEQADKIAHDANEYFKINWGSS